MKKLLLGRHMIIGYLKHHRRVIVTLFFIVLIFIVVFSLYSLPLDSILYALLLSLVMAAIINSYDFMEYCQKYKVLCNAMNHISLTLDTLPEARGLLEQKYKELLLGLQEERVTIALELNNKQSDLMDYFTLWVHQIKTPIAAIRVLLQLEGNAFNKDVLQELFKIDCYVETALQYLRLENMSSDLRLQQYSLFDIVKQAIKKYAAVFIHNKIKLELEESECTVLTDEKWLVFVLEQIISNALKYTKEGSIFIYMEEEKTLVIEDTGIGIDMEDLPRIFEKGFTGYNGRIDKKSTGIGLYLCKRILNKLSHKITITSKVGTGTRVSIDLSVSKI